jgi:hypothetical protein
MPANDIIRLHMRRAAALTINITLPILHLLPRPCGMHLVVLIDFISAAKRFVMAARFRSNDPTARSHSNHQSLFQSLAALDHPLARVRVFAPGESNRSSGLGLFCSRSRASCN